MCGPVLSLRVISGKPTQTAKVESAIRAAVNQSSNINRVHLFDKETGNVIECV
jgi:hypothetical protein